MPTDLEGTQHLYDVELLRIDTSAGTLYFSSGHLVTLGRREELRWWQVGEIGVLRLGPVVSDWGWQPYPNQRLRRAPERDDPAAERWGWSVGNVYLSTKVGVIPDKTEAGSNTQSSGFHE